MLCVESEGNITERLDFAMFSKPDLILSIAHCPAVKTLIRFLPDKCRHVEIINPLVGTGRKFFR